MAPWALASTKVSTEAMVAKARQKALEAANKAKLKAAQAKAKQEARKRYKKRMREYAGLIPLDPMPPTIPEKMWEFFDDKMKEFWLNHFHRPWRQMKRGEYLIARYTDHKGDVVQAFRTLRIDMEDQMNWLEFWYQLDDNGDNRLEYKEFIAGFALPDDTYVRRFYELVNVSLTGFVSFKEFLITVWDFLVFDTSRTLQLAFRLMSRMGKVFDEELSALDIEDIRIFLEFRYPELSYHSLKRRAEALYCQLNTDGKGGVSFQEFNEYCCEKNIMFVMYSAKIQRALRKRIFGESYWEVLTRTRTNLYQIDEELEDKITAMLKADDKRRDKPKDFNKEFRSIITQFKEGRQTQERVQEEKKRLSWTRAEKARDRAIELLEDLDGDRGELRHAFRMWRVAVGLWSTKGAEWELLRRSTTEEVRMEDEVMDELLLDSMAHKSSQELDAEEAKDGFQDPQTVYDKILKREERTRKTGKEIYKHYKDEYMVQVHRTRPDPSYDEISWHHRLIRAGKHRVEPPPSLRNTARWTIK